MNDPEIVFLRLLVFVGLLFAALCIYWQYQVTIVDFPDMGFLEWVLRRIFNGD